MYFVRVVELSEPPGAAAQMHNLIDLEGQWLENDGQATLKLGNVELGKLEVGFKRVLEW